jgi:hypothetical protein
MPAQKKKVPERFEYNKVIFARIHTGTKSLEDLEKERKQFRKDGYYTKVRKVGNQPWLYISEYKRPAYKSPSRKKPVRAKAKPKTAIQKEYGNLNKKTKKELVKIAQSQTRLDISHIKNEPKSTVIGFIMEKKFGRKMLEKSEQKFKSEMLPLPHY